MYVCRFFVFFCFFLFCKTVFSFFLLLFRRFTFVGKLNPDILVWKKIFAWKAKYLLDLLELGKAQTYDAP